MAIKNFLKKKKKKKNQEIQIILRNDGEFCSR